MWRTNVFHLPVRGSGDGGIYSTAADISSLWRAFFAGRIVSPDWVARDGAPAQRRAGGVEALRPGLLAPRVDRRRDAGGLRRRRLVPHRARPARGVTHTVISNTTDGAWPITRYLEERLVM